MKKEKFKRLFILCLLGMISIIASAETVPNNEIWYTSWTEQIVTPNNTGVFGATITSNTYSNGKGVIKFDGEVTSIGDCAFYDCSWLASVTIPNSVTSIGYGAFYYCSGLTSVTIGNSVTTIGESAFAYCSGLTSVTIPNSVTSIGEVAFEGCSSLTSVTIPNSVTEIGPLAFGNCSGLTSMVVESGNTVYDSRDNCNAIIETKSNTLISGCKNTIIPNSVTSIGNHAFSGCSGLTSVTIPNSVTEIGEYAFYNCEGLTSVTIGNSVKSICDGAFFYCEGLTSVTIPNSVTSIGYVAFIVCSSLTSMVVESGNTVYDSRDNCNAIIETKSNTLISGCKNTIIPNSVTSIGNHAFSGCSGLTSVTIPNSVTTIEMCAFSGCSGLTSVTIPNSVTSIGYYAFEDCSGLTSVTIPNSVIRIGNYAFCGSGLTSVTIPNSVTSIGLFAFYGCSGLTRVYVEWKDAGKIPSLTSDDFPYSTCDLYVPTGVRTIYQSKEYWSTFRNIYESEPESVLLGDANGDGSVNVNDISTIAAYILEDSPQPFVFENADANGDGVVNVNDISATATIILDGEGGGEGGDSQVYLKCPDNHHPHVIDLGLPSGTKWCCCNVGATTPEGYGGYYAWGETSEKSVYNWDTYAYYNSDTGFQNIGFDIAGTQYDVAHVRMGGSWRMPNVDQMKELINNCTRTWTNQNGVNGILLTGKNGGQIFLPAAGYRSYDDLYDAGSFGYYWSSSLYPDYDEYAYDLSFYSGNGNWYYHGRDFGPSVRAVCP